MLARLICFLIEHVFDELDVREGPQNVYSCYGTCARCGVAVSEVCDLRNDDELGVFTVD